MPLPAADARAAATQAASRLPAWAGPAAVGLAAAAVCTVVAVGQPGRDAVFPPCPFRAATGLDCPGCGAARGLHALLGGHIGTAADHNVLMVLAVPFLLASWVLWTGRSLSLTQRTLHVRSAPAMWWLAASLMAWWVLRNVPVEPLSWFASGRS